MKKKHLHVKSLLQESEADMETKLHTITLTGDLLDGNMEASDGGLVFFFVLCILQTGVSDDRRHPGHPAAPSEANCSRPPRLQHRHLQPRVPEFIRQGPAGLCRPNRSQPEHGSNSTTGTPNRHNTRSFWRNIVHVYWLTKRQEVQCLCLLAKYIINHWGNFNESLKVIITCPSTADYQFKMTSTVIKP